ncbi:MAG: signal peptidase I [Hespellia sp.]|nr:signal peptidase I [Hespellia sp.]
MMNIKERLSQQFNHLKKNRNEESAENTKKETRLPEEILFKRKDKVQRKTEWKKTLLCLGVTAAVVYLLAGVIFGIAIVHGSSMSPTFQDGDLIFYNRLARAYDVKDVILFRQSDQLLVKRIIGMPGEEIDIDEGSGTVLINAMPLDEPYIFEKTLKKKTLTYPIDIGQNSYFVMGDQRGDSYDSRDFGLIEEEQITGKVMAVFRL